MGMVARATRDDGQPVERMIEEGGVGMYAVAVTRDRRGYDCKGNEDAVGRA